MEYARVAFIPEGGESASAQSRRFRELVAQFVPLAVEELRREGGENSSGFGGSFGRATGTKEVGSSAAFTMKCLANKRISGKTVRELRLLAQPLSVGHAVPQRQDLSKFRSRMERAMENLCMDLDFEQLRRPHLLTLGPHILGNAVWERLEGDDFDSWEEFKEVVQKDYGLTGAELRWGFTELARRAGETDDKFILRVE